MTEREQAYQSPSAGHGEHRFQLFVIDTLESSLKPFKTLAQLHNLTDNDDCGRTYAGIQRVGSDRF